MRRLLYTTMLLAACVCTALAQVNEFDDGFTIVDNSFNPNRAADSLRASHKKVPKGLKVWTIDERFGDIVQQKPDTLQHLFMNSIFTTGTYGEYNTTGNLGAPRIARIATDRDFAPRFHFAEPYGYFITKPSELRFTNTLSPITHLYYNSCGDKDNGEDHIKALFATNINKKTGFGFKFDYIYGRGYYQNQSTALFDYTLWGSYIGQRYQAHAIVSFDHMKAAENGGISNDEYITHPEAQSQTFETDEIPTVLRENWNRNDAIHATLSHRYSIGFTRQVPMTEDEKEARRFALKSQQEREEMEALAKGKLKDEPKGRPGDKPTLAAFSGRPDNARIAGDLPTDSVRNAKIAQDISAETADSLLAKTDSVASDTSWMKEEYVPVTSFIHNLQIDKNVRTYIARYTPSGYYNDLYDATEFAADANKISDRTRDISMRNSFAIGLLEGFNKYVPMGAKIFAAYDLRHYVLPGHGWGVLDKYNESDFSAGVQLSKALGHALHYNATGEIGMLGENIGDVKIDGTGDINLPLWKDTVRLELKAFYHLTNPTFLQRHYHSKHFWWDSDGMNKQMHTHAEGVFSYPRTRTTLRAAYDNLQNYVYLSESYERTESGSITGFKAGYRQSSKNISLMTLALHQEATYGILNWAGRVTIQKSSDEDILPVPLLNVWTNLFLKFRIAKVLKVDFGAEMFIFTSYNAPEYCPQLLGYAVQENEAVRTKVGNYPFITVYCNFKLRQCRFFAMMSHVNAGMGSMNYFLTPHHPLNDRIFRLGLAWTFNN